MQYAYTSLKTVIGNVVRNTRIQDSSFIADIHEWLYEAMDMLETNLTLVSKYAPVYVNFHKAKLPCGLRWIEGVEYNGHRLRENGGVRPPEMTAISYNVSSNVALTEIQKKEYNGHAQYITNLTALNSQAFADKEYYYTDMGVVNTSFCDGVLIIYFKGIATDEDGFPMIPDNQNYKQALYWYCRAMMIGAGWIDPQFSYKDCFEQWEVIYGPRATGELAMPSPEGMERLVNTLVRFIPDQGYYDSFFHAPPTEAPYDLRSTGTDGSIAYGQSAQQPFIPGTGNSTTVVNTTTTERIFDDTFDETFN